LEGVERAAVVHYNGQAKPWLDIAFPELRRYLNFWKETASYRPGWQAGDGRKASLPARFIRVLTSNLADLFTFSGLVDAASPWFMETFDENAFATHLHMQVDAQVSAQNLESIKVHQPGIEAPLHSCTKL
jgi:lipopolysaccharide biosynthesis glycosyltransferase